MSESISLSEIQAGGVDVHPAIQVLFSPKNWWTPEKPGDKSGMRVMGPGEVEAWKEKYLPKVSEGKAQGRVNGALGRLRRKGKGAFFFATTLFALAGCGCGPDNPMIELPPTPTIVEAKEVENELEGLELKLDRKLTTMFSRGELDIKAELREYSDRGIEVGFPKIGTPEYEICDYPPDLKNRLAMTVVVDEIFQNVSNVEFEAIVFFGQDLFYYRKGASEAIRDCGLNLYEKENPIQVNEPLVYWGNIIGSSNGKKFDFILAQNLKGKFFLVDMKLTTEPFWGDEKKVETPSVEPVPAPVASPTSLPTPTNPPVEPTSIPVPTEQAPGETLEEKEYQQWKEDPFRDYPELQELERNLSEDAEKLNILLRRHAPWAWTEDGKNAEQILEFALRVHVLLHKVSDNLKAVAEFRDSTVPLPSTVEDLPEKYWFQDEDYHTIQNTLLENLNIAVLIATYANEWRPEPQTPSLLTQLMEEGPLSFMVHGGFVDSFNAHQGMGPLVFFTDGIRTINEDQRKIGWRGFVGEDSKGGIFVIKGSSRQHPEERLHYMLQPLIIALRGLVIREKYALFDAPILVENPTMIRAINSDFSPNQSLFGSWYPDSPWLDTFNKTYGALEEFCDQSSNPELWRKILFKDNILDPDSPYRLRPQPQRPADGEISP